MKDQGSIEEAWGDVTPDETCSIFVRAFWRGDV